MSKLLVILLLGLSTISGQEFADGTFSANGMSPTSGMQSNGVPTEALVCSEDPTLNPFSRVCLDLINSFRTSHRAPRLVWNATLATAATRCANQRAQANDVTTPGVCRACGPAAETTGFSANMAPSQRCRSVIQDPVQFSWFSQYTYGFLDFSNPVYSPMNADYVQMIWMPTRQVGCGTSRTTATITNPAIPSPTQYILSCCWDQGVVPSTIGRNIREDTV